MMSPDPIQTEIQAYWGEHRSEHEQLKRAFESDFSNPNGPNCLVTVDMQLDFLHHVDGSDSKLQNQNGIRLIAKHQLRMQVLNGLLKQAIENEDKDTVERLTDMMLVFTADTHPTSLLDLATPIHDIKTLWDQENKTDDDKARLLQFVQKNGHPNVSTFSDITVELFNKALTLAKNSTIDNLATDPSILRGYQAAARAAGNEPTIPSAASLPEKLLETLTKQLDEIINYGPHCGISQTGWALPEVLKAENRRFLELFQKAKTKGLIDNSKTPNIKCIGKQTTSPDTGVELTPNAADALFGVKLTHLERKSSVDDTIFLRGSVHDYVNIAQSIYGRRYVISGIVDGICVDQQVTFLCDTAKVPAKNISVRLGLTEGLSDETTNTLLNNCRERGVGIVELESAPEDEAATEKSLRKALVERFGFTDLNETPIDEWPRNDQYRKLLAKLSAPSRQFVQAVVTYYQEIGAEAVLKGSLLSKKLTTPDNAQAFWHEVTLDLNAFQALVETGPWLEGTAQPSSNSNQTDRQQRAVARLSRSPICTASKFKRCLQGALGALLMLVGVAGILSGAGFLIPSCGSSTLVIAAGSVIAATGLALCANAISPQKAPMHEFPHQMTRIARPAMHFFFASAQTKAIKAHAAAQKAESARSKVPADVVDGSQSNLRTPLFGAHPAGK